VARPGFARELDDSAQCPQRPGYPGAARQRGLQGKVVLRVGVSTEGLPTSAVVATSSGHSALDQAALAAMQRWRRPGDARRNARVRHRRSRSSSAWKTD
jgi:TonB family protein